MNLKMYRRIAGLSQGELAAKSGVDVTIISRLEHGTRWRCSYENTVRLARALNLEPEELMPVDLDPNRPATEDTKEATRRRRVPPRTIPPTATAR